MTTGRINQISIVEKEKTPQRSGYFQIHVYWWSFVVNIDVLMFLFVKRENLDIFLCWSFLLTSFFGWNSLKCGTIKFRFLFNQVSWLQQTAAYKNTKVANWPPFCRKKSCRNWLQVRSLFCVRRQKGYGFFTRKKKPHFPAPKTRHERVIHSLFQKGSKRELWFCSKWFVFFAGHMFLHLETSSTKHPHSVLTFLLKGFFCVF